MTTRLYMHPISLEHITPPGHPERPDRMRALEEAFASPLFSEIERKEPAEADPCLVRTGTSRLAS